MELSCSLLLAPSLRPPSNLLLRILLFLLLLWPNASLLWPNASLCRCTGALARLKHQLKRTRVETNEPRKLTVTAHTIFSPPHKAQMVSEGESQGRHLDTGGGFTRKHESTGLNGQLPCILDRQRRLPKTLRDHVRSASALSALKESLVANLPAKRQLSVAKLSAKRIFSLAKRNFLDANGRMAADFSSPDSKRDRDREKERETPGSKARFWNHSCLSWSA